MYYVFFKGRDEERISIAFSEYSQKLLKEKPSIRKALRKFAELAKSQDRQREKVKDRGMEL